MDWKEGNIEGLTVRRLERHRDARGWLSELFRRDTVSAELMPVMGYISVTHPGVTRGPHEHVRQTDTFAFAGPGTFRVKLWDNREDSPTYGHTKVLHVGEDEPTLLAVPPGVVHGYQNVSETDAWVLNFPNRLFRGPGRKAPVDEIRHEDREDSEFRMT